MEDIQSFLKERFAFYLQHGKGENDCIDIAEEIAEEFDDGELVMITAESNQPFRTFECGEVIHDNDFHVVFLFDNEFVIDPLYSNVPTPVLYYLQRLERLNHISFSYTEDW